MGDMNKIKFFKIQYPYIYKSIVWTPILAFFALLTGGAGHGVYIFIKLLYPYSVLIAGAMSGEHAEFVFLVGLLLYIFYGLILTLAQRKGKDRRILSIICVIHAVAFVLCVIVYPSPF
jgi:hypothetical protein